MPGPSVARLGAEVTTIKGLGQDGALHPLQDAFIRHDAFQGGYCTPGQLCPAAGLLAGPGPSAITGDLTADAVCHATGRHIRDLPITPAKLLE